MSEKIGCAIQRIAPQGVPAGGPVQPFLSVEGGLLWAGAGRIDWQVRDDEHWAVVGPNGSGKTAFLRAVAGRRPLAGGRIVYQRAAEGGGAERVALVEFGLERRLLGLDQPYYGSRWNSPGGSQVPLVSDFLSREAVLGLNPFRLGAAGPAADGPGYRAVQDEVFCLLDIEHLLDRSLVQLSSGERRKVLVARALLRGPRLLLLDDPLAGLDEESRSRLAGLVAGLMGSSLAVVVAAPGWDGIPAGVTHALVLGTGGGLAAHPGPMRTAGSSPPARPFLAAKGMEGLARSAAYQPSPLGGGNGAGDPAPALVHMEGASVRYGGVQVLSGVDWTVRTGERWVLLGPNGAGKTTLLSLILGDNPQAYANRISLFGRRRGSGETIWEIKARVGWVAPELESYVPALSSCLEVACSGFLDSVGLHRPPTAGQQAVAADLLERLGLLRLALTPFGGLSGGQKRAVLVARALIKDPALLVLDEPCQGLDATHRDRILALLDGQMLGSARALIYVTHDPLALPGCITHLLRLEAGRVAARGRLDCGGELEASGVHRARGG